MRQRSLVIILIWVVCNSNIFIFNEMSNQVLLTFILFGSNINHYFQLFLLHFHDADGLFEILLEIHDSILVCFHGRWILFFLNFETISILFKNLSWSLFWKCSKQLFNITLSSRKYLKFRWHEDEFLFANFLEESFQQNSSFFDKVLIVFLSELYALFWDAWNIATWPSWWKSFA